MLDMYADFVKCLAENNIHCFLGIPSYGNVPTTYCLGFLAEKEVNGLMEELFETVSKDLWVRMDGKSRFFSKLCFWVPGPLPPEWCSYKANSPPLVHPGENIMAGECW